MLHHNRRLSLIVVALGLGMAALFAACSASTDDGLTPTEAASTEAVESSDDSVDGDAAERDSAAEPDAATGADDEGADTAAGEDSVDRGAAGDEAIEEDDLAEADTSSEIGSGDSALGETAQPVVFNDDFSASIAPIFEQNCAACHNAGGPGAVHWQVETAADLVATHQWVDVIVASEYMPPWPASDNSISFKNDRSLSDDQIAAIRAWSEAGAPLDVSPNTPITAPRGLVTLDADDEIFPHESYQGTTAVADDYRCFVYELGVTEPTWMQGFEFLPDQTEIVHHAIGYLAPRYLRGRADQLSRDDDIGGWQCYGGSRLGGDVGLFLGWAPGQDPTMYPEGSGLLVQPGDFVVLQIHYHLDREAPPDSSTLKIDWSEGQDLDAIRFGEFLGPAEIPCTSAEEAEWPLCDRDNAIERAIELYGDQGVLADSINRICGLDPEDVVVTNLRASSSCTLPVRDFGEIVSVFGHMHEIGSGIRMTLNPGRVDEALLLDIPDWSFDWQYNYEPVDSIVLEPGDVVLLECEWDRSRRDPALEPAYVLWADGTNDEMCFATISTRGGSQAIPAARDEDDAPSEEEAALLGCLVDAGVDLEVLPARDEIDATVDALFDCGSPEEIGEIMIAQFEDTFGGLLSGDAQACLADRLSERDAVRASLVFSQPDATEDERRVIGELVADCVSFSSALSQFGFPLPESTWPCLDEVGYPIIVDATIDGDLPDEQDIIAQIAPCLSGG